MPYIWNCCSFYPNNFDASALPMCGFCYGTKLYDRAKEGFWFSTKVGFTLLLSWAVVLMIFNQKVTLFRNAPEVTQVSDLARAG